MDLPTCPACQQSVLDDDAVNCPFCGAPMSGAPRSEQQAPSAPAAAKAPKSTASDRAAAGGERGGKQQPAARTTESSPPAAPRPAAVVVPKKTPQATLAVRCPMCESSGFVPPRAAGKPVKCANPDCLVPIFTAPEPPPKPVPAEPEEVPASGGRRMAVIVALSVLVSLAGGVVAWMVFVPDSSSQKVIKLIEAPPAQPQEQQEEVPPDDPAATAAREEVSPAGAAPAAASTERQRDDALRRQALEAMVAAAVNAEPARKKDGRRSTAEAFARAGDVAEAREQLKQLRVVAPELGYYFVTPLVEIAWAERAAGRTQEAGAATDEALKSAANLPPVGRLPFESAVSLAALLIVGDRAAEAESLLAATQSGPSAEEAWMRAISARSLGTFDFDAEFAHRVTEPLRSPKSVAVVYELCGRGDWDAAVKWVSSRGDADVRRQATVALAEMSAALDPGATLARIEPLLAPLSSSGRALVLARAAVRQRMQGGDVTSGIIERARAEFAALPEPLPVTLPTRAGEVHGFQVRGDEFQQAALAAAEIARAEAVAGDLEASWQSLEKALAHVRASAPAWPAVEQAQAELAANESAAGESLRSALGLQNELQVRDALRAYRVKLRELDQQARVRFRLEEELLQNAIAWGLADRVETLILADNSARQFPFERSSIPWLLAERQRLAGNASRAQEIENAAKTRGGQAAPQTLFRIETERSLAESQPARAAGQINTATQLDRADRALWTMRLVVRLVNADQLDGAFQFLSAVRDPLLREDGYELLAARAARRGSAADVWQRIERSRITPTERVAAGRGLFEGLRAGK